MRKFLINSLFLLVAVLSGVGLFVLKYQVKEKEAELARIHREILKTKRQLHMLEAEWAHLNDPKRLKELVTSQTDWKTIQSNQLIQFDDLPMKSDEKSLVGSDTVSSQKGEN